jgi:hypothetical protein
MQRKRQFLFILIISVIGLSGQTAPDKNYWGYGVNSQYGFIIVHSHDIRAIKDSYPFGIQFDIARLSSSSDDWNQCQCFPELGFSFSWWHFDNPRILGQSASAMFYLEPRFTIWRKWHFSFRGAFGLAWLSNPHDDQTNPDNLSYSTALAFPLAAGLYINYKMNPDLLLKFGAVYNHISNGGIKEPNKGINYPTLSAGIMWYPGQLLPAKRPTFREERANREERTSMYGFFAIKQVSEVAFKPTFGIGAAKYWPASSINQVGVQTEFSHHTAQHEQNKLEGKKSRPWMGGVAIAHAFPLGRFHFSQAFGWYYLKHTQRSADFYQRYALVYRFGQRWFGGVSLNAHGRAADFIGLRFGLTFS